MAKKATEKKAAPKQRNAPKPKTDEATGQFTKNDPEKAQKGKVIFKSAEREGVEFDICGVRPCRDQSFKRLIYRVPEDSLERFRRHHHVLSGRIVEAP